jgi:FKBP-type peptidyl-prolyl cis-trans isomerase SlyD
MKIEKNKVVVLSYELEVEGKVVDAATQDNPLNYIQGMHMLIPRFEDELEGLEEGAAFSFTIQPEEGYGSYDEKRRILLPKSAFTIQGEVREDLMEIGRILPMVGADGSIVNATVVEVKEEGVTMDFNHPMAGKVLNFKGKVLSVRDATEKELTEGLHGEFLPPEEGHHCCHGKGKGHCHHHHEHEDGECCGHHDHGDGECCGHGHCHHEEE